MAMHRNEKEIIRILFREARPLSIREAAQISGMSWITAKKYLERLSEKNIISILQAEKVARFELNNALLKRLHERRKDDQ